MTAKLWTRKSHVTRFQFVNRPRCLVSLTRQCHMAPLWYSPNPVWVQTSSICRKKNVEILDQKPPDGAEIKDVMRVICTEKMLFWRKRNGFNHQATRKCVWLTDAMLTRLHVTQRMRSYTKIFLIFLISHPSSEPTFRVMGLHCWEFSVYMLSCEFRS